MKKTLAVAVVATGLAMLGVLAAVPASAHVVHAYHGDRGHAWTNTAHTRVGVADTRCDNRWVQVRYYNSTGEYVGRMQDADGCRSGNTAGPVYWAYPGLIQVCVEGRGCGRKIKV